MADFKISELVPSSPVLGNDEVILNINTSSSPETRKCTINSLKSFILGGGGSGGDGGDVGGGDFAFEPMYFYSVEGNGDQSYTGNVGSNTGWVTDNFSFTMPPGANAAIYFHFCTSTASGNGTGAGVYRTYGDVQTTLTNATFTARSSLSDASKPTIMGYPVFHNLSVPGTSENYARQSVIQATKYDLILFEPGAEVQIKQSYNIINTSPVRLRANLGRTMVIPFTVGTDTLPDYDFLSGGVEGIYAITDEEYQQQVLNFYPGGANPDTNIDVIQDASQIREKANELLALCDGHLTAYPNVNATELVTQRTEIFKILKNDNSVDTTDPEAIRQMLFTIEDLILFYTSKRFSFETAVNIPEFTGP